MRSTTIQTITDELIYAARSHARQQDDDLSAGMMGIALNRDVAHPATKIALAYTVDYINTKMAEESPRAGVCTACSGLGMQVDGSTECPYCRGAGNAKIGGAARVA